MSTGAAESSTRGSVRMGQREVKSCNFCYRRKVKCDKVFPCSRCVSRGLGELCEQQTVIVNGRVTGGGRLPAVKAPTIAQLLHENKALHRKINAQEKVIRSLISKYDAEQQQEQQDDGDGEGDDVGSPEERSDSRETHSRASSVEHEMQPGGLGKTEYLSTVGQIFGLAAKEGVSGEQRQQLFTQPGARTLESLRALVPLEYSLHLVQFHCKVLHWIHAVFHVPTFIRTHDEWISSICSGQPLEKSYDFYALYFAVIACSLYFMDDEATVLLGLPKENIAILPRFWFETSLNCLQLSGFMVHPSLTVLQTICILPMVAHAYDASCYIGSLMNCALGLARDLNFHLATAGTNPDLFGGVIQCELVRRIWMCLAVTDSLRPDAHHPFHLCLPTARTAPPANVDDVELQDDKLVVPHPLSHTTGVTHLLAIGRLATLFRDFNQTFGTKDSLTARFKCVKSFDGKLQTLLSDMPDLQPRDNEVFSPSFGPNGSFDYRPWSRFLWTTVFPPSRIMLYRWFLGKSYSDKRYSKAREVCLAAARQTLAARRKQVPVLFQKNWHVSSFTVLASMVLATELIYGGHEGPARQSLRTEVVEAAVFIRSFKAQNAIVSRGATLLDNMVAEADAKVSSQSSSSLMGPNDIDFSSFLDVSSLWPTGMDLDAELLNALFQSDVPMV